jgi:hypothetical protein
MPSDTSFKSPLRKDYNALCICFLNIFKAYVLINKKKCMQQMFKMGTVCFLTNSRSIITCIPYVLQHFRLLQEFFEDSFLELKQLPKAL